MTASQPKSIVLKYSTSGTNPEIKDAQRNEIFKLEGGLSNSNPDYSVLISIDNDYNLKDTLEELTPDILIYLISDPAEVSSAIKDLDEIAYLRKKIRTLVISPIPPKDELPIVKEYGRMINELEIYPLFVNEIKGVEVIFRALDNPPVYEDDSYILDWANMRKGNGLHVNLTSLRELQRSHSKSTILADNVIVFTSVKPGSGKSTISSNSAIAAAQLGLSADNKPLKVAILEADPQNYSLSNLLGIDYNFRFNLLMTLIQLHEHTEEEIENDQNLQDKILQNFVSYGPQGVDNLYTLTVPNTSLQSDTLFTEENYRKLLKFASTHFDLVIVDTNSKMDQRLSIPIFKMATYVYEIVTLDDNNVKNLIRNTSTLKKEKLLGKIRYVLNEAIDADYDKYLGTNLPDKLHFGVSEITDYGIELDSQIPMLPHTSILNAGHDGLPIFLNDGPVMDFPKLRIAELVKTFAPVDLTKIKTMETKWKGDLRSAGSSKAIPKNPVQSHTHETQPSAEPAPNA